MKKTNKTINLDLNLLDDSENNKLFLNLQYVSNSLFKTDIIAVTAINNDSRGLLFAYNLARSYNENGSKTLIIDANFYESAEILVNKVEKINFVSTINSVDVIKLSTNELPGDYFRSSQLEKLIKENKEIYARFLIVVPSISRHKEIGLLNKLVDCVYLIAEKNVTKNNEIFDAIEYCKQKSLPLARVVLFK